MQDDVIVPPSGRPDKSDAIRRAVEGLLAELSRVRPMMDSDHPRIASGAALSAVMRFLATVDPNDPGDRRRPLGNLLAALASLEEGSATAPLLEPAKKFGGVRLAVDVRTIRAQAVAIAEILVSKAGMTTAAANHAVGDLMYKSGFQMGGEKTPSGNAVAEWRRNLQRTTADPQDLSVYKKIKNALIQQQPAQSDQERAKLTKALLVCLSDELRAQGFKGRMRPNSVE